MVVSPDSPLRTTAGYQALPWLRAMIVDDEPLARDELCFLLSQCQRVQVVGQAANGSQALELFEATQPNLVFVDLRMPGPDGIAVAETLMSKNKSLNVVVVSAHDDGAIRAYEARVLDYLLKPVRLARLEQSLERAHQHAEQSADEQATHRRRSDVPARASSASPTQQPEGPGDAFAAHHEASGRDLTRIPSSGSGPPEALESQSSPTSIRLSQSESTPAQAEETRSLERLAVRRRSGYVVIDIDKVVYFEVRDELVWAVTADDRLAIDLTLTALEKRLPQGQFIRTHRGVLVRIDAIRTIEPQGAGTYALKLDHPNTPKVPLARERARGLRKLIPFTG